MEESLPSRPMPETNFDQVHLLSRNASGSPENASQNSKKLVQKKLLEWGKKSQNYLHLHERILRKINHTMKSKLSHLAQKKRQLIDRVKGIKQNQQQEDITCLSSGANESYIEVGSSMCSKNSFSGTEPTISLCSHAKQSQEHQSVSCDTSTMGETKATTETPSQVTTPKPSKWKALVHKMYDNRALYLGILFALLSHIITGFQPVVGRQLQKIQGIPSMSLNGFANLLILVLYSPRIVQKIVSKYFWNMKSVQEAKQMLDNVEEQQDQELISSPKQKSLVSTTETPIEEEVSPISSQASISTPSTAMSSSSSTILLIQNTEQKEEKVEVQKRPSVWSIMWEDVKPYFRNWVLYVMGPLLVFRSSCSLIAAKWTLAIYVQLINLSVPFLVSICSALFAICLPHHSQLQQEKLNWKSLIAMVITVLGGGLIILGSGNKDGQFSWKFSMALESITANDLIGMSLALVGCVGLAIYSIFLRLISTPITSSPQQPSATKNEKMATLSGENLFIFQLFLYTIGFIGLSLILREDWSVYRNLSVSAWFTFVAFAFFVYGIGNLFYIGAIQSIGASGVASCLAVALVSTIAFSYLLINEPLSSIWQVLGSAIVMVGVTLFMIIKAWYSSPKIVEATVQQEASQVVVEEHHSLEQQEQKQLVSEQRV